MHPWIHPKHPLGSYIADADMPALRSTRSEPPNVATMSEKLGLRSEANKNGNRFFNVNFEELHLAFEKPDEKKKGISEIGREPSFNRRYNAARV